MKHRRLLLALSFAALSLVPGCGSADRTKDPLAGFLAAGAEAIAASSADGAEAFERYRMAVADAAERGGDSATAEALRAAAAAPPPETGGRDLASRLLRGYVVARYGPRMIGDLQTIVGFRTYKLEDRDNWDAPEFLRQRAWLAARAAELGLEFATVDGRVEEITLPGEGRTLGILTHGDVQGVEGQTWTYPPWEGQLHDGRIYGRGTEDDKGPIVTTMAVFAALGDSGWPLGGGLRLMVSNGEECCWDEIPYYLERRDPPDVTIGFDAAYPVTYAQKAWARIDIVAGPRMDRPADADAAWEVTALAGGSGLSIIPERGEARLRPPPGAGAQAVDDLRRRADAWAAAHPPARLEIVAEGGVVRVVAHGRGGHSSTPDAGHNALGDLVKFLHDEVPVHDADGRSALIGFLGRYVGTETDARSLGFGFTDLEMGPLTFNLAILDEDQGRPRARSSARVPRGYWRDQIVVALARTVRRFRDETGFELATEVDMPRRAHYVPPDGPLVQALLEVWKNVTGQPGEPVSIGGGTQAQLFPDGVDFGPALAMERYRGHGPDEYMTVEEMNRNAELTIAALWALSREPGPPRP